MVEKSEALWLQIIGNFGSPHSVECNFSFTMYKES